MNPSLELKPFNSFGIDATAKSICIAESAEAIYQQWLEAKKQQLPVLILGGGSNVLFIDNFDGVVILNRIKGINVTETADDWQVYSAAGENWHQFIEYLMNNGINGAENLALIPGCVGSAPIQNIGAYGVELKDICEYVDMLHLITGETVRIKLKNVVLVIVIVSLSMNIRMITLLLVLGLNFLNNGLQNSLMAIWRC